MIDKYQQAFQEEAREVLLELESALLELNDRRMTLSWSAELSGRCIRSKVRVPCLDLTRSPRSRTISKMPLTGCEMGVLPPRRTSSVLPWHRWIKSRLCWIKPWDRGSADDKISASLLSKLRELTGEPETHPAKETSIVPGAPPIAMVGEAHDWHLRLSPKPDLLRNGANPLVLFRELRAMGNLQITAETSAIPSIVELEPQRCYIIWDLILTTAVTVEGIRDVFIFVKDGCDLVIEPAGASRQGATTAAAAATAPAKNVERSPSGGRRSSDKEVQGSSIRVAAAKLDQLVDLMGQLVTVQVRLGEIAARSEDRDLQAVAEEIEALTSELRDNSMSMRTQPLRSTFERFKRLVFDLGRTLHKDVELTYEGGDTELDKTVIEQLNDPLMHLIRNTMDHGVELPDVRRAAGKNPMANIHFSARHSGAQVQIRVSDDGKGIDREAVRARAIRKRPFRT